MPCATESTMGTLNQKFRYEAGRNLIGCHPFGIEQIWISADLTSCRISLFLVCFRFHVFSDLAILYLYPLPRRVHLMLCLPGGHGRRDMSQSQPFEFRS